MELIGQLDSPFTRRVAITLDHYGLPFANNNWSVFGNAKEIADVNPLIRVPTLVLDGGEALIETWSIIDYIDTLVAPEARLWPQAQPARRQAQKIVAVASGVSDKAVVLFYELRLHEAPSPAYVARLEQQIAGGLVWLEVASVQAAKYWIDQRTTQADLAVACSLRHLREAHPQLFSERLYPSLAARAAASEELEIFKRNSQPFVPPA
jgi:glutathione S-transferase